MVQLVKSVKCLHRLTRRAGPTSSALVPSIANSVSITLNFTFKDLKLVKRAFRNSRGNLLFGDSYPRKKDINHKRHFHTYFLPSGMEVIHTSPSFRCVASLLQAIQTHGDIAQRYYRFSIPYCDIGLNELYLDMRGLFYSRGKVAYDFEFSWA
ncbi:hypothetical protein G9A89_002308 [Geosiphon pyriformis]|nr:hypothetical protein G9A89_002308 [Geosiphon pyriformis]